MNNGIYKRSGDYWDWMVDMYGPNANPPTPQAADSVAERRTLLVDRHGKALIKTGPRPVGFRPR